MRRATHSRKRDKAEATKRYRIDGQAAELIQNASGEDGDTLLSTKQVAAWLRVSEQWLEARRNEGTGPDFHRFGPRCIRYRRDAVLKFLAGRTYTRKSEYLAAAEA